MAELVTFAWNGEQPDVIAFRSGISLLLEAKTSRSDFHADWKKAFRAPGEGMGNWRFFITPPGLLKPTDDLRGWGLLEYDGVKVRRIHGGPKGNVWGHAEPFKADRRAEQSMMFSGLRRLQLHHGDGEFDTLLHRTYAEKKGIS